MASHDFCPGCPKCDAESRDMYKWDEISRLEKTITELNKMKANGSTADKIILETTIIMVKEQIDRLKSK